MRAGAVAGIELHLTRWDLLRSSLERTARSHSLVHLAVVAAILICHELDLGAGSYLSVAAGCWIGLIAISVALVVLRTRGSFSDGVLGRSVLTFLPEGYAMECRDVATFHRWSDVIGIHRDRRGLRLMLSHTRGHIIPVGAFDSARVFEATAAQLEHLWRRDHARSRMEVLAVPHAAAKGEVCFERSRASFRLLAREQLTGLWRRDPWAARMLHRMAVAVGSLVLCVALTAAFCFGLVVALSLLAPLVAVWSIGCVGFRCFVSRRARSVRAHDLGPVRVMLTAEGLLQSSHHRLTLIPWRCIAAVDETDSFILLRRTAGELVAVPKQAFRMPTAAGAFARLAASLHSDENQGSERRRFSTHPPPAMV